MHRSKSNTKLGRRLFLGTVSSAAAALPFLRSFPLQAHGGDGAQPKLLFFGAGNGPLVGADGGAGYEGWLPAGVAPPEGQLPDALPDIYSPLDPFRDNLLFVENLATVDDNTHRQTCGMLTGRRRFVPGGSTIENYTSSGISVDQFLGNELDERVLNTAFRISGFAPGESYWSYRGQADPVTPIQDPVDSYQAVFGEGLEDTLAAEILARRTSVLDVVAKDLGTMRSRVPSADRPRLEAHLDSVRQLEKDLIATAESGCHAPGAPNPSDALADENAPAVIRAHADVIAQAFACGWSRIAMLQLGTFGGELRCRWPDMGIDTGYTSHAICHAFDGIDGAGSAGISQAEGIALGLAKERAYSTLFAYVLERLQATTDVDGMPLLDNTLVTYVRPMGRNHDSNRILWIAAGGAGVGLSGGRFIRVGDGGGDKRHYNDYLTTVCAVMGNPVETFGDPQYCKTPISLS